jgi:hypothetical protein
VFECVQKGEVSLKHLMQEGTQSLHPNSISKFFLTLSMCVADGCGDRPAAALGHGGPGSPVLVLFNLNDIYRRRR